MLDAVGRGDGSEAARALSPDGIIGPADLARARDDLANVDDAIAVTFVDVAPAEPVDPVAGYTTW